MIVENTPIEEYDGIYVKREDLSCLPPGPPFAKVRGLYKKLQSLKENGITTVGYCETSISMAGWGIAWIAKELGMKTVIFNPIYKCKTNPVLEIHRSKWEEFGADVIDIPAGMAKVNFYITRQMLFDKHKGKSFMLPLGIPFEETINEVSAEFIRSHCEKFKTIIMCVGSGTMAAGILKGIDLTGSDADLFGILCRPARNMGLKRSLILAHAGIVFGGDFFYLIDLGYGYTEKVEMSCPFPCNPYYDLKAFKFLSDCRKEGYNKYRFKEPILFWNIGA